MNQKKNKLIIITMIVISILILTIGIAYIIVATDTFKSDKKLFLKYATQTFDTKKGFVNSEVIEYFKKQKNTPFETNGELSFNIANSDIDEDLSQTNKCKISFSGQVDLSSSKILENIDINYAEDVKFPFVFEKSNNVVGIQTDYIGSKFICVELDKLSQIDRNLDDINFSVESAQITDEQFQYLTNTYLKVINNQLKDNNFSNVKDSDLKGYKLTLSADELKQILITLLETTRDDHAILTILNEFTQIDADDFDKIINELNNDSTSYNENIEITFFVNKKKVQKISLNTVDIAMKIEKDESGNTKQYNIDYEYQENNNTKKLHLIAKYSGLQSLQLITENYEFGIEYDNNQYIYYLNNEVNFVEGVNINNLTNSNAILLNSLEKEQSRTLINAIEERMTDVNRLQMERLGLTEDKNPLIFAIPNRVSSSYSSSSFNYTEESGYELNETEINTFNSKFDIYESTNSQGATVKGLLSTILNNNEQNEDDESKQILEINFDGQEYEVNEENIVLIKSEIKTEDTYKVEFEKDENTGKIYRVVINKK